MPKRYYWPFQWRYAFTLTFGNATAIFVDGYSFPEIPAPASDLFVSSFIRAVRSARVFLSPIRFKSELGWRHTGRRPRHAHTATSSLLFILVGSCIYIAANSDPLRFAFKPFVESFLPKSRAGSCSHRCGGRDRGDPHMQLFRRNHV